MAAKKKDQDRASRSKSSGAKPGESKPGGVKPEGAKSHRTGSKRAAAGRDGAPAAPGTDQPAPGAAPAPAHDGRRFPVVGIGASAGGLEALKTFFGEMPAKTGMAFVVVPHLDPTHKSLMVDLLGRFSSMAVVEAADGKPIEPDRVYVIPPNKYLAVQRGVLRLTGPVDRQGPTTSIDFFLRSLAVDQQEQAIGVIMSGTSTHGTLGIKEIKAHGGMAMVQDPDTAEYDQMPRSAIATGLVDFVLPAENMPAALLEYIQQPYIVSDTGEGHADGARDLLTQIVALLRARARYDFRCYRKTMLQRRVERRMGLSRIEHMADYVTFLRDHPDEIKQLTRDLLISVTQFFRDVDAFRVLADDVIPDLVRRTNPDTPLRVWIPACATGEEAYSIAILLSEHFGAARQDCHFQMFATDVDDDALAVARQGRYPESISADVSRERLERFFSPVAGDSYEVNKPLRDAVTFSTQNLLRDAPFSRMDLINCRNVLIYLEPEVQHRLIPLFHFALNEGGYLLLGSSETIGRHTDLFEPVSKKWRIYRRRGHVRPQWFDFPIMAEERPRGRAGQPIEAAPPAPANLEDLTESALLALYAPAAVVATGEGQILYFHGPTMMYLDQPSGEPTRDLFRMARNGLRPKLRAGVRKAVEENGPVCLSDVKIQRNGIAHRVQVDVRPLSAPKAPAGLLLITFRDLAEIEPVQAVPVELSEASIVRHLEHELKAAREELQTTIEEFESSSEELKAGNEETMSINEELQSANEELETSKEELQSLNEELTTVNSQLQEKNDSLESLQNDLANLLNGSQIATLFLSPDCRIRRFTAACSRLFKLLPSDVGRPLTDITHKFTDDELRSDIERVLSDLAPVQREVLTTDGAWFIRRVLPYRTIDNRIDGVVVTFSEVTLLKQAEIALQQNQDLKRLATVLVDSNDAIILHELDGRITAWNRGAERMYGYSEAQALALRINELIPKPGRADELLFFDALRRGEAVPTWETQRVARDGRTLDVSLTATLLRNEAGEPTAISTTERDMTEKKRTELALREIALEEQRRIGQDLHDGTGQELTGLGLLGKTLADALRKQKSPDVDLAESLVKGIQRVLTQIRTVSRNLIPVEVDSQGLTAALTELAGRIDKLDGLVCTFEQKQPVSVEDHQTATQLYRIAQEAVTNSIRHGQVRRIIISLDEEHDRVVLRVQDDGVGIQSEKQPAAGMGLSSMRYRAELIYAKLDIEAAPGGGTVVTCIVGAKGK